MNKLRLIEAIACLAAGLAAGVYTTVRIVSRPVDCEEPPAEDIDEDEL